MTEMTITTPNSQRVNNQKERRGRRRPRRGPCEQGIVVDERADQKTEKRPCYVAKPSARRRSRREVSETQPSQTSETQVFAFGRPPSKFVAEDVLNCPVCVESFDELELRFHPCPCGYRVCAMCVHLIKEKANGKCPHCRQDYSADEARISDEIDSAVLELLNEVKKARDTADGRVVAKPDLSKRSVMWNRRQSQRLLAPPAAAIAARSLAPSVPSSPEIKLTRHDGGLSVWD